MHAIHPSIDDADRELERRVFSYLAGRHVPALRHLQVTAADGTVTLEGRVRTFHEKQLSHACTRRVAGVHDVIDAVRVVPSHRPNPHARRDWRFFATSPDHGRLRRPR
jgi:hypothetical protein